MPSEFAVLGIETSCDETSCAVVDGRRLRQGRIGLRPRLLSNVIASSQEFHRRYGGVVPEIASRYHVEVIHYVLKEALREAGVTLDEIRVVCVTQGPGLAGSLLVGIALAKGLALARGLPVVGVNHLKAHLYANLLADHSLVFPYIGLLISGGHTCLALVEDVDRLTLLGETRDDAVGEAFDKVAKLVGLGYPGGPEIEQRAKKGNPNALKLSRPYLEGTDDFSFSGLKTAVLYYLQRHPASQGGRRQLPARMVNDIAASFQACVVDVLVQKAVWACQREQIRRLAVGGGVIANQAIRAALVERCGRKGIQVWFPPMRLCLDNAGMIAGLGVELYWKGTRAPLDFTAQPEMLVTEG